MLAELRGLLAAVADCLGRADYAAAIIQENVLGKETAIIVRSCGTCGTDGRSRIPRTVNYHRLTGPDGEGLRTLPRLLYDYLGDCVTRQKAGQREGIEGAEGRLTTAVDSGRNLS